MIAMLGLLSLGLTTGCKNKKKDDKPQVEKPKVDEDKAKKEAEALEQAAAARAEDDE